MTATVVYFYYLTTLFFCLILLYLLFDICLWLIIVFCDCRIVHTLDHNFRSATRVVQTHLKLPIKPENAVVKIIYAGVNASDVWFSIFANIQSSFMCHFEFPIYMIFMEICRWTLALDDILKGKIMKLLHASRLMLVLRYAIL